MSPDLHSEHPEPKPDFDQYFDCLGLPPNASLQDIRAAYSRLYLEHLDSPPSIPEPAVNFAQIQAAYEILQQRADHPSDPDPEEIPTDRPPTSPKPGCITSQVFDPDQMQMVRQKLAAEYQAITDRYEKTLAQINQQKLAKLEAELLEPGLWGGMTAGDYWLTLAISAFLCLLGAWVIIAGAWWVWWVVAGIWSGFWGLVIIGTVSTPRITAAQAKRLKPIQDEINQSEQQAKTELEQAQKEFQQHQQEQVAYFISLPRDVITDTYIASLRPIQQFYLLKAIQKRQDSETVKQNLKTGAKILAGVGLLAALFTGLPFL